MEKEQERRAKGLYLHKEMAESADYLSLMRDISSLVQTLQKITT